MDDHRRVRKMDQPWIKFGHVNNHSFPSKKIGSTGHKSWQRELSIKYHNFGGVVHRPEGETIGQEFVTNLKIKDEKIVW